MNVLPIFRRVQWPLLFAACAWSCGGEVAPSPASAVGGRSGIAGAEISAGAGLANGGSSGGSTASSGAASTGDSGGAGESGSTGNGDSGSAGSGESAGDSGSAGNGGRASESPFKCQAGQWDDDRDPFTPCMSWTTCPVGTHVANVPSATEDRDCVTCPEGTGSFQPNSSACSSCQNGGNKTQLSNGKVVCDCPPGTWGTFCELTTSKVAASLTIGCALKSDQTLACWGGTGGATTPRGKFTDVMASNGRICGLREDGAAVCSPANASWPNPLDRFKAFSLGPFGWCGIRSDDALACGYSGSGLDLTPPPGAFMQVSMGWQHACGLKKDRTAACWGRGEAGQLNPPDGEFLSLAVGQSFSCGLRPDHTTTCWGFGAPPIPSGTYASISIDPLYSGFCGVTLEGRIVCDAAAGPVPPGEFDSVAAGSGGSCGLRKNGQVVCFGGAASQPPSGVFSTFSLAPGRLCGVTSERGVACWGPTDFLPAIPPGLFTSVALGDRHLCGIQLDGTVICSGSNDSGQLDAATGQFAALVAGGDQTCGLKMDGTLACWGANDFGQSTPPMGQFKSLAVSKTSYVGAHACGITDSGKLQCWGDCHDVIDPNDLFADVDAGVGLTCAVKKADGALTCFGAQPLAGAYRSVALAGDFSDGGCALKQNGTVDCWGYAAQPEISHGSFETIAAASEGGGRLTCGLAATGRVECWGGWTRPEQ